MCNFITPDAIHILGGAQPIGHQTEYCVQCKNQTDPKPTWWGRFKEKAKKFLGKVKDALEYTKDVIVPIITATAGLFNSLSGFHRCDGTGRRDYICAT